MKKYLIMLLPLLFFFGCSDDDSEDDSGTSFDGTWQVAFMGEFENADCSGAIDSTGWAFAQLFGLIQTLEVEGDSYTMSVTILGETEQMSGTFTEVDGDPCLDGECLDVTWGTGGEEFSTNMPSDAYCEDYYGEELSQYTDQTSCEDSGNDWYDASCTIIQWEKQ